MRQEALATKPIFDRINGQKRHEKNKNGIKMIVYSRITVFTTLLAVVVAHSWKSPQSNTTHNSENNKVQTPQVKAQHNLFKLFIGLVDNPSVDKDNTISTANKLPSSVVVTKAFFSSNADNPSIAIIDTNTMGEESKPSNTQPSAWRGGGCGGRSGGRGRGQGGQGRGRFHHRGG